MRKVLAIFVLIGMLVAACGGAEPASSTKASSDTTTTTTTTIPGPKEGLDVGDMAPDVELVAMDGTKHKLSDFRGQVVLINFWATWCGPCRYEMPSMQEAYEQLKDEGFVILAVDVGEDREKVEAFMQELNLTFPAFLDKEKEAYSKFNKSNGIPQSYVIDRNGIIRFYQPGAIDWTMVSVMGKLKEILEIEK